MNYRTICFYFHGRVRYVSAPEDHQIFKDDPHKAPTYMFEDGLHKVTINMQTVHFYEVSQYQLRAQE